VPTVDITASSVAGAVSAVIIGVMLLGMAGRPTPEQAALRTVAGESPAFVRFDCCSKYGDAIHFGENRGVNCVFDGPSLQVVEDAVRRANRVEVLCDFSPAWYDPPLVYSVSVDGKSVVSYDQVAARERRDHQLGIWSAVFCFGVASWYFRRAHMAKKAHV
jgi:hypothetical protein